MLYVHSNGWRVFRTRLQTKERVGSLLWLTEKERAIDMKMCVYVKPSAAKLPLLLALPANFSRETLQTRSYQKAYSGTVRYREQV